MESRVTTLQNELRQREEGSVARVVQAQEAARMARVDAATHLAKRQSTKGRNQTFEERNGKNDRPINSKYRYNGRRRRYG